MSERNLVYCDVNIFLHYIVQAKLQEFLGRKDLDKHLDADEAIVLGASLNAANLSDGIKLNRKLGMVDGSSYGFLLELNGPELLEDNTDTLFIPRLKKMPIKVLHFTEPVYKFQLNLSDKHLLNYKLYGSHLKPFVE